MIPSNLHTHTVFCDGNDTPEELVLTAISLGCGEIGFSGHAFTDFREENPFCMSKENTKKYKEEVNRLKRVYKDKIKILLGLEKDYFSNEKIDDYDYVIGSVHYVYKDGEYLSVDESKEMQVKIAEKYYGGDFYAFAEDYYKLVGDVYYKTKCDIVGHFDLITKFNEGNCLFDTNNPRYINAVDEALKKLLCEDVKFEINFGAIARGYRKTPYPEERILEKIASSGKEIIKTSDCHKKEQLLFGLL